MPAEWEARWMVGMERCSKRRGTTSKSQGIRLGSGIEVEPPNPGLEYCIS